MQIILFLSDRHCC